VLEEAETVPTEIGMRFDFSRSSGDVRLRLSTIVVGMGILLIVSLLPFFQAPFGGAYYWRWLSALTALLGCVALYRRETGHVALASAMMTVVALGVFLLTVLMPLGYSVAMRLFMSE